MKKNSLALLLLFVPFILGAREVRSLNEGWSFFKGFVKTGPVAGSSFGQGPTGEAVTLPHCWNADEFQKIGATAHTTGLWTFLKA